MNQVTGWESTFLAMLLLRPLLGTATRLRRDHLLFAYHPLMEQVM